VKNILAAIISRKFTPWLLLILTILSFGLLIPAMGYFMDDWYLIWFKHTFGALQYPAYFSLDRPLMGYFYVVANALLFNSESPVVWHIFGLLTRWLCTLALWQFLNTLWPKNERQNTWVALLAAVFPGFIQHWIVVVYSFFYTCLAGLFFSFTLMIRAVRDHKHFWLNYILSILIGFYSFAAAEFYSGLELIRPVILWIALLGLVPVGKKHFWQVLKYWAPYLAGFIGFTFWRAFFFESMNHAVAITGQLSSSLRDVIVKTAGKLVQTIIDSSISVWTQTVDLSNYPSFGKTGFSLIILALVVFSALALWLRSFNRQTTEQQENDADAWGKQSFWLGAISLVVALMPFWAADLEVSPVYPYDRFLLAYLMGSCLLIAGLINQFSRSRTLQVVFLSLLVATSTAFQYNQMVRYRTMADYQRNLIWQLVWRAPDLKPGTAIMAYGLPYQGYLSDNALTTELQWVYSNNDISDTRALDYAFIFINSPHIENIEELSPNHAINYDFRTYKFVGNTNQTLMVGGKSGGCLRLLDEYFTPAQSFVDLYPKPMLDATGISNLDTVITSAAQKTPPAFLFGSEPAHTWCYYFEKAELARQVGDYAQAYDLIQQATQLQFAPKDLTEWYPYIDASLRLGHFDEAVELSRRIIVGDSVVKYGVCHTWENYISTLPKDGPLFSQVQEQLGVMECN
jgi:tetratricopeptide (TPR) repeat protein